MDQILMEQQLSFDYKLNNINQVNSTLDKLQRKMNSYFQKSAPDHMSQNAITRYTIQQNNENGFGMQNQPKKTYIGTSQVNERQRNSNFNYHEGNNLNNKKQLQFKLYKNAGKQQQTNHFQTTNKNFNQNHFTYQRDPKDLGKQKKDKERLSQTTIQKVSNVSQNPQNRSSSNFNSKSRKNNDQFRLIGKSRQISVDKNGQQFESREGHKMNMGRMSNQKPKYQENHQESYLKEEQEQVPRFQYENKQKQNNPLASNYSKSRNNLVHEMETVELLMKERLDIKQRNLKHIEQQIMTENEERVYLYKINVRLNEELKLLQQQDSINEQENTKNLEWNIKRLQEDVDKLKKQIAKKKNERKQLRKQEQTLKDGYQIVLNNKKNILRRDIESYINKQTKAVQNTQMLKGLIKQLEKLKGVVQDKIKSSITSSIGKPIKQSNKRKVIKSFKV